MPLWRAPGRTRDRTDLLACQSVAVLGRVAGVGFDALVGHTPNHSFPLRRYERARSIVGVDRVLTRPVISGYGEKALSCAVGGLRAGNIMWAGGPIILGI